MRLTDAKITELAIITNELFSGSSLLADYNFKQRGDGRHMACYFLSGCMTEEAAENWLASPQTRLDGFTPDEVLEVNPDEVLPLAVKRGLRGTKIIQEIVKTGFLS